MAAITGTDLSVIDESLSSLKGEMEEDRFDNLTSRK